MFNFFYNLSNTKLVANIALLLSHEITYFVFFLLFIWALFQKHKRMFSVSLLVLSGFFAWFLARILKYIFHIPRPFMTHDILPLVFEKGYSFPSEHTTVFFALATAVYFLNRRTGFWMYILAFIIGISRIIIGVHYPVDILAGAVLGIFIGFIFIKIFKKI